MFNDIDDKYNDIFSERYSHTYRGMDYMRILYISGAVFIALLLLGCCCRRRRNRGTVLSPAPVNVSTTTPAPYPQQQYIVSGPVGYPPPQNVYPSYSAAPAPGPVPPHNPPYPTHNTPYPPSTYPYPAPYVQQPQPYPSAPSAPDANALPPPYDQVCAKQPPYNQATH